MMALPINSLYSLTWGDYGTSLVSAIQLLRCHGDLVDCTLAAGGRSFPAHKIVLCAASPFLLELLKNTPCKHPVVMLAGVNANDLEALLEFVYRGEVSVDHSQLPSLLQAAHCLNIQGLAPQTVTKDDYTTQIHLQPMTMPQHHDQEQLITTIGSPQTHTVHAQVVEDITEDTITAHVQDVKDVIQQFLPARKRKPRVKKSTPSKVAKTEHMQSPTTTIATTAAPAVTAPVAIENNCETQLTTAAIKTEQASIDPLSLEGNSSATSVTGVENVTPNATTTAGKSKARARSQSEQPATCPICFAIIRQSRNLRRHLELRHFAKSGVKKERKSTSKKSASTSTNAAAAVNSNNVPTVQSVQTVHTLQTVQVKKEPDSGASSVTPVAVTVSAPQQQQQHIVTQQTNQQLQQLQQQQQQHQQMQTHTAIIDQSGNITTTTAAGNGQQTETVDGQPLSIAHVQTLQGHQLTLGNMNQATIIPNDRLASGFLPQTTINEPIIKLLMKSNTRDVNNNILNMRKDYLNIIVNSGR